MALSCQAFCLALDIYKIHVSASTSQSLNVYPPPFSILPKHSNRIIRTTHLIEIDDRFPELILRLVEITHADLSKVTRVVFVKIGAVMMLSTGHTTTTGMFSMLAYAAVTGGDVAAAAREMVMSVRFPFPGSCGIEPWMLETARREGTVEDLDLLLAGFG